MKIFKEEKKKGQFTVETKRKKKLIIEEGNREAEVSRHEDAEKKALEQTGDDATSGW